MYNMNVSFGLVSYVNPSSSNSPVNQSQGAVSNVVDAVVDMVSTVASAVSLFDGGGSMISSALKGVNIDISV